MIRRIIILAVGGAFALLVMQVPAFVQQYTQRLGGWHTAYALELDKLQKRAENLGQSRDEYIAALRVNKEPEARQEGEHWARQVVYFQALDKAYKDLTAAPPWMRLIVFIEHYNSHLAKGAWEDYELTTPATVEGAAYGAAGFAVGWLLVLAGGMPYRIWQDRRLAAARKKKFEGFDPL
jgi:hypothetical protein